MSERFFVLVKPYLNLLKGRRVVKVAGTNGKGSLCAMLEACVEFEGLRAGLFTSPHLSRVTERFRVGGVEVSPEVLERHAEEVLRDVRRAVESRGEASTPSFFECLILIALRLFREERVDVAIFEAGVGGYNDAVSLLPGEFSAITSIGMDHRERLGDSLEAIAADKAGIASPDSYLIPGPDIPPTLRRIIEADACARGITVCRASLDCVRVIESGLRRPTLVEVSDGGEVVRCELPLLGRHQVGNFATLVALVRVLARRGVVGGLRCLKGVGGTRWAGRLEVRDGQPSYVIDAAHNEQGVAALVASLSDLVPYSERVLLYGASAEKDYRAYLPRLPQLAPEVYLVEGFHRAERTSVIKPLLPGGCRVMRAFGSPEEAVKYFAASPSHRRKFIVAAGSIFMIGELMSRLDSARDASVQASAEAGQSRAD